MTESFDTAEKTGAVVGGGLALLCILFGILKCIQIMRRPTASKLCVAALLLVFIAWGFSAGTKLAVTLTVGNAGVLMMLAGMVTVLLMLVALVLGIVGVSIYDSNRFLQGRAQGIWAIVLSGLIVVIFGASAVVKVVEQMQQNAGSSADLAEGGAPRVMKNEQFNFSLTPKAQWREVPDSKQLNQHACLGMRLKGEDIFMTVIAEEAGPGLTLKTLADTVKLSLATTATVKRQIEESTTINGLKFVRVKSLARNEEVRRDFFYEQWLATHGGYCWQVLVWGFDKKETLVSQEAEALVRTFRLLKEDRMAGSPAKDRANPEYGYATHLEADAWNAWDNKSEHTRLADFSAQRHYECFLVVPLRFESGTVEIDAAAKALLSTVSLRYPAQDDETNASERLWSPADTGGKGAGLEIRREVKSDDGSNYLYFWRIAHWPSGAVMVGGWAIEGKGDLGKVEKAVSSMDLHEPRGAAPPMPKESLTAYGIACNQIGLAYFKKEDYVEAARWFKTAFEQTRADAVILENVGHAMEKTGHGAEALEYLKPYDGQFTHHLSLEVRRARLMVLAGRAEEGEKRFAGLLDKGLKDEDELRDWMKLLAEREDYAPAIRTGELWLARRPSLNIRRWLAQTVFASGDHKKALGMFEEILVDNPGNPRAAYELAEYCNDAGENARAAEVAEKILATEEDSSRALMALGWSQMGRKWYKDAKTTFERAARKSPKDSDIQEAIRTASAALGQGNNSDIKEILSPVEIPPQVASALNQLTAPAGFGEGYPYVSLLRATGYHYVKGQPARRTLYRHLKVLDSEGAKELSSMEFAFNPLAERIFMNRLEVRDPDGKVVARANVDDAYVRDLDDGTASSQQVLHLQVEGVKAGCTVECEVTIQDRSAAEHFEFSRHLFAHGAPVAGEAVFVTGDTGAVKFRLTQGDGVRSLKEDKFLAWIVPPQDAAKAESFAIWAERRCPMLSIGGDEGDWTAVAKAYLKQIEDRLVVDKDLKELASRLVDGIEGPEAKVAALARHVQKEISYKAIEFGVRARRPNAGTETLRSRYGDCKDHSLLLHLLLKAAGVTSHLALVNTDWETEPALPSLDQFNHMVVQVPALGKDWLIDPTDKTLALAKYPAEVSARSAALCLNPTAPGLIPKRGRMPEGSCRLQNTRTVILEGQDWLVEDEMEMEGYYASAMRDTFSGLTPSEQRDQMQSILSRHGPAQVESFRFEALENPDVPARLVTSYRVRDAFPATGSVRQAALPAYWEQKYLSTKYIKDRRTDFEFLYPFHLKSHLTLKLPAKPETLTVMALKQNEDSPFCTWHLAPGVVEEATLVTEFEFHAKTGEHPASSYASFHNAWEVARRAWDRPIKWEEPSAGGR